MENRQGEIVGGDVEWNKVRLMRAFVEGEDPASKDVDDLMLRIFLRARDLDIEKASNMFLKYLKWKGAILPNGFISELEIPNQLSEKKMFLQGFDKKGHSIGVVFGAKHRAYNRDLEEFKRFVVYILEKLCASTPSGQEKFIVIADLQGWGLSHCDIRGYLAALDILQNNYPERLAKAFLIHVPYVFMTAWKIVYPFIDKNTKKRFIFVEKKNLKTTLLQDIDESQLPDIYGGKLPLVPIQDS
ncbi:patellin-6-like [Aristolochia californica]|uniref:patellin-6-like n=1 Tax=Aristolochia californica TaxID=171875 RepID=UPI0035DD4C70